MSVWLTVTITLAGLLCISMIAALAFSTWQWQRTNARWVARVLATANAAPPTVVFANELTDLPPPVVRYFRYVLRDGQAMVRSVRLEQRGQFRLGESADSWRPLSAIQHAGVHPPAFAWDATIRTLPLLPVRVRDAYLNGQGSMVARIAGLITVVHDEDKPELTQAALQRYLAEAAWFPTALLPSQGVRWSTIDEHTALATLSDSSASVSLAFHFNTQGEIIKVYTAQRFREVNGRYEPTPWAGHFRDYQERGGMRIPLEGEVEWQLGEKRLPYWRARLTSVEFDFAH